jgi:hypothetical protein
MREYKVFAGNGFIRGKQVFMIVAAKTQKRASELTGLSTGEIRNYWSITGNKDQIETAMSEPETVFYIPTKDKWMEKKDWQKMDK